MNDEDKDRELMPPPPPQIIPPEEKGEESSSRIKPVSASEDRLNVFPAIGGPQRADAGIPRKKPLAPGHSPMDWAKLKSTQDLRGGVTQIQRYTIADLKDHTSQTDMWMAFQGKVYNVTKYLPFHPGGIPQLRRGAGKDATELIMTIHPWVNVDMMLDKCFIGYLLKEG